MLSTVNVRHATRGGRVGCAYGKTARDAKNLFHPSDQKVLCRYGIEIIQKTNTFTPTITNLLYHMPNLLVKLEFVF